MSPRITTREVSTLVHRPAASSRGRRKSISGVRGSTTGRPEGLGSVSPGARREPPERIGGKRRPDLGGQYFRSAWEANYARYLNFLAVRWEYEPHTFWFAGITRGSRSYTPDFRVTRVDGSVEWHEVKGWMDQQSRTRLKRMAKYYPAEKIVVVGRAFFTSCARSGMAGAIAGWERVGKDAVR